MTAKWPTETREQTACARCGAVYVDGLPVRSTCHQCPPVTCAVCQAPDDRVCRCWTPITDLPLADLKAFFARDGLSVGLPKDATS